MSRFTGELRIKSLRADCTIWQLEEPLHYAIESESSPDVVVVPSGFQTDGASIPQFAQSFLPAWGKWSRAAIIHDYLCRCVLQDGGLPLPSGRVIRNRSEADAIFYEAMIVSDVPKVTAWIMYRAVCLATRYPRLQGFSAI